MSELSQKIARKIGLKLVEIATRQGNVPFYRGDLRKSITSQVVERKGDTVVVVGSNLVYARAVHDGKPAITIRPKRAKVLAWWTTPDKQKRGTPFPKGRSFRRAVKNGEIVVAKEVHQPARSGNPFLSRALQTLQKEGFNFVRKDLNEYVLSELLRKK
jgi:phage gpG-like protein